MTAHNPHSAKRRRTAIVAGVATTLIGILAGCGQSTDSTVSHTAPAEAASPNLRVVVFANGRYETGGGRLAVRLDLAAARGCGWTWVEAPPRKQVAYQLAYGDMGHAIDTVLVDGTPVVRDGKVVTVDVDAILAEAAELAARIWKTLPDRLTNYERTAPLLQRLEQEVRHHPWSRSPGHR